MHELIYPSHVDIVKGQKPTWHARWLNFMQMAFRKFNVKNGTQQVRNTPEQFLTTQCKLAKLM